MSAERQAEQAAHDELRDAIRRASLAQWDRMAAAGDDVGDRADLEAGILVDYVVAAIYTPATTDEHTVTAILRTDGQCPPHRTVGLLATALRDQERG